MVASFNVLNPNDIIAHDDPLVKQGEAQGFTHMAAHGFAAFTRMQTIEAAQKVARRLADVGLVVPSAGMTAYINYSREA